MSSKRYFVLFLFLGLIALVWLALSGPRKPAELKVRGQSIEAWSLKALAGDTNAVAVIRETGARAVPNLVWQLKTRDSILRKKLRLMAAKFPQNVRVMVLKGMGSPLLPTRREAAAFSLSLIGSSAALAVPDLAKALEDDEGVVRWKAATALARIGKNSVPRLVKTLNNHDSGVRWSAVYALGEIGSEAATAIPALMATAGDTNEQVRNSSFYSLSQLGPAALFAIAESTQMNNKNSREISARLVQEMDRLNQKPVPST